MMLMGLYNSIETDIDAILNPLRKGLEKFNLELKEIQSHLESRIDAHEKELVHLKKSIQRLDGQAKDEFINTNMDREKSASMRNIALTFLPSKKFRDFSKKIVSSERKLNDSSNLEDDNILNLSKSSTNDKTSKTLDRRTSKTKRGDVKARSVNLGGLIGLWKGIEEKDGTSETVPPVPQTRTPTLERKIIKEQSIDEQKKEKESKLEQKAEQPTKKERKISLGRKSDSSEKRITHEKAVSLKKDQVEQTPPIDKNHTSYKDIDSNTKDTLKDSKQQKSAKTSNESSVTSLLSRTFEGKGKNDTKNTDTKRQPFGTRDISKTNNLINEKRKVESKSSSFSDQTKKASTPATKKSDTAKSFEEKSKTASTPPKTTTALKTAISPKSPTSQETSDEKPINKNLQLNGSETPPGTPELRRNSRTGSLRRGEIKRASLRRRSKVDGDATKLADDFDKIFKRLSIGSELSISNHDISTILDQVSENQDKSKLSNGDSRPSTTTTTEVNGDSNKINKTNEINRSSLKSATNKNEKSVLNDKTNTLRKTPTSPKGSEVSLQKGKELQEKNKIRRNEGFSTLADRNNTKGLGNANTPLKSPPPAEKSPRTLGPRKLSPKSEKKLLAEKQKTSSNDSKKETSPASSQPKQKTATQAKLEEIAARREALRKKYLERSHSENSIALEKKERFRRQGFAEGQQESFDQTEGNNNLDKPLTCEVPAVTTSSSDNHSPESISTDSGYSAESRNTQILNRSTGSLNEDKSEKKKKKLIRKNPNSANAVSTPPVRRKNRDVQKILRRLSLNIPPPTPEEIEEEMEKIELEWVKKELASKKEELQRAHNKSRIMVSLLETEIDKSQDLTELERRKLALERRRRSLQQSTMYRNSTEDEPDNDNSNRRQDAINNLRRRAHSNSMDNNDSDELDQMIAKQNKSSKNNLNAYSEEKFKKAKSQPSLQRSSSDDEPRENTKKDLNNNNSSNNATFGRESVNPAIKTITAPRRGSINEKKQKLFEQPAKDIPIVRTKPVAEVKDLVTGKIDNKKESKKVKKERMMSKEPPTVETFKKQSAWLEKLVQEAAANDKLGPDHTKPKDYTPTRGGRRSSRDPVEKKPEIDKEAIRENVVEEPTNLGERKKWLEKLVRRSTTDKRTRLSKTRSLCNLSTLNFDDDEGDDDEDASISKPISRQVSVEEISKSIDTESRGNAFMLPSAIRMRRSMGNLDNLEQCYTPDRRASLGTLANSAVSLDLQNRLDHLNQNEDSDEEDEVEVDDSLKETIEAIQLPNIHERMSKFQETSATKASPVSVRQRRRPRKERPKSYAGEHLSQLVFENGSFRPKDGQILGQNANPEIASSIGKVLMVNDNPSEGTENNNDNDTNNENNTSETPREMMQRKRQNRRSLFSNQRILAEIAEMEQREQEIMDERTKASDESEKHIKTFGMKGVQVKEYENFGIQEEKPTTLKNYPKGLERFLQENEKR